MIANDNNICITRSAHSHIRMTKWRSDGLIGNISNSQIAEICSNKIFQNLHINPLSHYAIGF